MSEPIKLTDKELLPYVRRAFGDSGWTQVEASQRLDVKQGSISKALNDDTGRYAQLQARLINAVPGWACRGPLWEITKE